MAIARIKSFIDSGLKSVSTPLDRTANLEPEVGIRIVHSPFEKALHVTVIGARHLPQNFGFTRVNSYVVKVKLIPGKDKFETTAKNESWPAWNEDFTFQLSRNVKPIIGRTKVYEEDISASKFVLVTVYAVLEEKPLIATEKKETEKEKSKGESSKKGKKDAQGSTSTQEPSKNKLLNQFFGKPTEKEKLAAPRRTAKERLLDKRRIIGATTIPLDPRTFSSKPPKPKNSGDVSTGELWRPLRAINSGISGAEERRESKKGQVEISLCQEKGEKDGSGAGNLSLSLQRFRCSVQTIQEQEALNGQLYIKMSVVDGGRVTHFWKSDRFAPCMSMKFSPEMAKVIAGNSNGGCPKDVSFDVKFVSKNKMGKMGKKTTVGHFVIGPEVSGSYGEQWKQALEKPGTVITKWQSFE